MATTILGQTNDQRQNPSKILFWAVGLAVVIILGLAFSIIRERNLSAPATETVIPSTPSPTPGTAPADRP